MVLAIAAGVAVTADAQTVLSGSYVGAPISGDIQINSGQSATFSAGTSFSGANATLIGSATLILNQNTTFTGKAFAMGTGATLATLNVGNGYSLTLGSGTTLTGAVYLYGSTGASITNQGSITETAGTGYFYGPTVSNSGTISALAGTSFYYGYYNGESTTNATGGTITANGSGAIVYLHNLHNAGTLSAQNGGILQWTGNSTTTADLGTVTLSSGGRAVLNGILNNSASTLNAPTGGVYELSGGTISGGIISSGAVVFTSGGSQLDNVTLLGNLTIPNGATLNFSSNSTFTGATGTIGDYATFVWTNSIPLSGKTITVGSGGAYGSIFVNNTITFNPTSTTTLTGNIYLSGSTGSTIFNQGTFNQTSGTGYFYAPTATNAAGGVVTASGGSSLYFGYYTGETTTNAAGGSISVTGTNSVIYLHSLINNGTLTAANNGVLQFTGASTTTANLGSVALSSGGRALLNNTIDNSAATLAAPTGGVYELYGGTINNGTVGAGALSFTNYGGTLSGVSFTGNLVLPGSTSVTFTNGTDFTGATATLGNYSQINWNQAGSLAGKTIAFGSAGAYATIYVGNGYSLNVDSASILNGTVYLYGAAGSTLTNQGTINHNSGTGYFYGPTATNAAGANINVTTGASLYFGYYNGETTTNAASGTITANGAGSIAYLHSLVNNGSLNAVNGGVLQFTGTATTTANLGSVTLASGGRALLNNTIDNSAATLAAPTGGVYELYGGTINNGTIGAGALSFTNYGGTLSGVSFTGNLVLPGSTSVSFSNGTAFTGATATLGNYSQINWNQTGSLGGKTIAFGSAGAYATIYVGNGYSLNVDSASILNGTVYVYGGAGSTLTNQGTINQNSGTGYFYGPTATNAANANINVTGGASLYFGYYNGETTTNAASGTITANGAGSIAYLHSLINNGSLNALNGGVLQFTGAATTTANLGSVTLASGGRALLNNIIDNTSATLAAPTGGMYELYGGTITNGTVAAGGLTYTNSGGTLSGVSLLGNFVMPASTSVTFTNGTAFTGTTATLGNYSQITWNQVGTLVGKNLTFGSGGAYATIYVASGNSLTADAASVLSGSVYLYGAAGSSLTNQGTINHTSATGYMYGPMVTNAAGGNLNVSSGASFYFGYYNGETTTNASGGTITATGTNSTIYLHNISNQGSLNATNNGVLSFTGTSLTTANLGSVTLASGGRALLNGSLDNTAATLNALIGGSFELYGGTIANGTVAAGGLSFTNSGGTVNGVSFAGDLTFPNNAYAYFTNGTSFTGANATLGNSASIYWQQSGALTGKTISMGNGAYIYVNGVGNALTLGAGTTLTGTANVYTDGSLGTAITNQGTINQTVGTGYLYARNFTNAGTINVTGGFLNLGTGSAGYTFANPTGATIALNGGSATISSALTNGGTINVQSGTLNTGSNLTNGATGLIMGSGTINGNLVVAGGTLSPGNSVGTLTLANSNFSVTAASLLNIEISAATADKMLFASPTSNVNIGSGLLSLSISLLSAPTNGTTYTIMSISGGPYVFSGRFAGLPNTGDSLSATFGGQSYQFFVNYLSTGITLNFTPVPEPSTYALLAAGLALVGVRGLRRRTTRVS